MNVAFLDLKTTYKELKTDIDKAIYKVLRSGWYINSEQVEKFEKEFADYCGASNCIGVGTGLSAIELLLKGHQLKKDDEILLPANTFIATALAVNNIGAKPVFVEPDLNTYNIDPYKVEESITKKTKAILAVHLYGQTANMRRLKEICSKFNLLLLEDAAQAHGAEHYGKKAGSLGDGAAFSFYPSKNLGAYGDGGAVVINNKKISNYIRLLRDYGSRKKYEYLYKGTNSRLDEIQAAILNVKLKHLDEWNNRRQKIADYYFKTINNKKNGSFILPAVSKRNKHVWHIFAVRTKKRDKFIQYLTEKRIGFGIHYPVPILKQIAYREMYNQRRNFPITNLISKEIISLPMGPHLKTTEIEYVSDIVNEFIANYL